MISMQCSDYDNNLILLVGHVMFMYMSVFSIMNNKIQTYFKYSIMRMSVPIRIVVVSSCGVL